MIKRIFLEGRKLYEHFDKILLLFAVVFAVMEVVWIPINSWLAELLLALTGQAYLSPTNLLSVLAEKWWVSLLFVLLVLLNLLLSYLEIGLLLVGVNRILRQQEPLLAYLKHMWSETKRLWRQMTISKIIYVLTYSVVFFPFLRKMLRIYYVDKLVIPQFILDYLANQYLLGGLMTACLLLFFWLAARLMYSLPMIYQEGQPVGEAVAFSLQKTKRLGKWKSYRSLLGLVFQTVLGFLGLALFLYILQLLADKLPDDIAFVWAILTVILLHLLYYGVIALFLLRFVSLISGEELSLPTQKKRHHGLRLGILVLASLYFGLQAYIYLYFPYQTLPVTISHRGVDNQNGVQNTLEALEKTAKLQPDYIEMDVQESKDGQFVVMHDIDLLALTGHSGGTHDYNLEELTQMMVSENGQSSPMASFEEYLTVAESLQQKLIVEIKTSQQDSPQLMEHFLKEYGKRLIAGGHQMQSLDYAVIEKIKDFDEQLLAAFILPFNSIYPTTVADAYTMEYTSLDQAFITKSWIRGKQVYAWTPNEDASMLQMVQLQVDGIITDNLQELKEVIDEFTQSRTYADLIFLQARLLFAQF